MILTLGISVDGLVQLVQEQRAAGFRPRSLLLHPLDAETLREDLILSCPHRSPDAEAIVKRAIPIIAGCDVQTHPHVARGDCWIVDHALETLERVH